MVFRRPTDPTEDMVLIQGSGDEFYIDRYEFPNQVGEKPMHDTTLDQARSACASRGKRLCTDAEWRRACLGPEGLNTYGYGPTYQPGRCASEGRLPSGHSGMAMDEKGIGPSGSRPGCQTVEGVFDLVGNLEEWVLSGWQGQGGALEGGAWFTVARYASCDGRYSRDPAYRVSPRIEVFSAGFRCCFSTSAPDEASLTREALQTDSRRRLDAARALASKAAYRRDDEVELGPGLFMDRYEYPNREGEMPLVGLTWATARGHCRRVGKDLCTAALWERACAGTQGFAFPYGNRRLDGACAIELSRPAPSGAHPGCSSEAGVMDLCGSVWEWTLSSLDLPDGLYPAGTVLRQVRGGSWFSDGSDGACQPARGYFAVPETWAFTEVGFRCCRGTDAPRALTRLPEGPACPRGMVSLPDLCIDRYEHPNRTGERLEGWLDFDDATAACKGRGLHLCTVAEWETACLGAGGRRWPYGPSFEARRCNHGLVRPGESAEIRPAGSNPTCVTPEGVFDLSGNLWEWVRTEDGKGVMRGGGLSISSGYGSCLSQAQPEPSFRSPETGARCCATAMEARALLAAGRPDGSSPKSTTTD